MGERRPIQRLSTPIYFRRSTTGPSPTDHLPAPPTSGSLGECHTTDAGVRVHVQPGCRCPKRR